MNPTTRRFLKPLGLLAIVVAIGFVSAALAGKGGKGKPPKDDPPQPPPMTLRSGALA